MSSTQNSSSPASPTFESIVSAFPPPPDSVVIDNPIQLLDTEETSPINQRHSKFYFADGNVIFLVENTLYKVHQYFFQRDSPHFQSEFERHSGSSVNGVTDQCPCPLALTNVKSSDFDAFLSILYPTDFRRPNDKTTAQWTSILHLAVQWSFETIKLLAIERLTATATPIDKIVLGRRYGISEWLADAYEAVCARADPLTLEEGTKLGMEDMVRISAVRQAYGYAAARYEQTDLPQDLHHIFGLEPDAKAECEELAAAMAIKELEEQIVEAASEVAPEATPVATVDVNCVKGYSLGGEYCYGHPCGQHQMRRQQQAATTQKAEEQTARKLQQEARELRLKELKTKLERERRAQEERLSYFR